MEQQRSYWNRQLSRRRVVGGAAGLGVGLAGLSLLGCGGKDTGSDQSSGGGGEFDLATQPDTTSKAIAGGNYPTFILGEPVSLDPLSDASATSQALAAFAYSRLLKFKPGIGQAPNGELEGDLVERWELAGDNSQLTLKLRSNAGTDPRPPLNGRAMTSEDVTFSFAKVKALSPYRSIYFNSVNPAVPILDVQAPDKSTIVLKLAFPYASLLQSLGQYLGLWIVPTEADGKFDPKGEVHGSGPFYVTQYRPSQEQDMARNPNFYLKGRPFFDAVSRFVIPEYAARLSQFENGSLWSGVVQVQDLVSVKRRHPQLLFARGESFGGGAPNMYFGWNGVFKDQRVRQALSMSIDRQLFFETFGVNKDLESAGVLDDSKTDSHIGAGWGAMWLDPFGKDIGEGGKYFKHDIAEAKKLLTAAGFASGLDGNFYSDQQGTYGGASWNNQMQVLIGMAAESGFRLKYQLEDYNSVHLPQRHFGRANWDGIAANPSAVGARGDPGQYMQSFYDSGSTASRLPVGADAELDGLVAKLLGEMDQKKWTDLLHQVLQHLALTMPTVPYNSSSQGFGLSWPWLANHLVYKTWIGGYSTAETLPFKWYDASKRPA